VVYEAVLKAEFVAAERPFADDRPFFLTERDGAFHIIERALTTFGV
jgi:hypothetical protein